MKIINNLFQMSNEILSSRFITIVLITLVITLQFDKCHSDKENFDLLRTNVKVTTDSILTAFHFDKTYFDSAETVRKQLLDDLNDLIITVRTNQGTILLNQEIQKKNQKEILEILEKYFLNKNKEIIK